MSNNIPEEEELLNELKKSNFEKHLKKLTKKLKNKKVVIYGAGAMFQVMHKYYDFSGLNIVGICDMKFEQNEREETFFGYKTLAPSELKDVECDYVALALRSFVHVMNNLDMNLLQGTKIKIVTLFTKPFLTLWKEIWSC